MDSRLAFLVSIIANFISFALIAGWYVVPRLRHLSRGSALLPLLLLHTFRTIGLTFLVPQVTGAPLPMALAEPAALGDLLATCLALLSVLAVRWRWPFALALVWIFNSEGTLDLLFAYYQGLLLNLPTREVGPVWYIPTLYVPLLLVSHVLIFWVLLRPSPSAQEHSSTREKPAEEMQS
jgi:hypothetical protein